MVEGPLGYFFYVFKTFYFAILNSMHSGIYENLPLYERDYSKWNMIDDLGF